ncbi:hypothetical protein MRB53_002929 [Persea americana]|uniref:Uncharacterized protein n=1 Tax=Persea americana TaxID=3435 RepID=A0ACC2MW45_PERAE|nr:hypothetical protein MRB53_002929 [Persea americana]
MTKECSWTFNYGFQVAVNIAADGDRTLDRLDVPLLDEDRPRLLAKGLHLRLWQVLALHQMLDLAVQIPMRRHPFRPSSLLLLLSPPSDLQHHQSHDGIYQARVRVSIIPRKRSSFAFPSPTFSRVRFRVSLRRLLFF